jgi:hypothetical protein
VTKKVVGVFCTAFFVRLHLIQLTVHFLVKIPRIIAGKGMLQPVKANATTAATNQEDLFQNNQQL